jgi:catechol 2,3-dioxygenase
MSTETIDPRTVPGAVHLTVSDLSRSLAFYTERLGFAIAHRESSVAHLGAGGEDLLVLWDDPAARPAPGTTGLYHVAFLLPSRPALGAMLRRLVATDTRLSGASDHLVSEALYLADPEGNGIEIYRDRPRGEWRTENGAIRMASDPIDLDGLLAEPGADVPLDRLPAESRVGHVHLRASDLEAAERFYVGVLGFERTARYGHSALFVAAGGYHHHIGLNTWAGVGAPPPPPGALGLRFFVLQVPDEVERDRVAARVRNAGVSVTSRGADVEFEDPFAHHIVLRPMDAATLRSGSAAGEGAETPAPVPERPRG